MTHYANLSLLNIIKKYNRINSKEVSFPDDYEDTFDQKRRYSLSHLENDALTDGLSDKRTPEDCYLKNELFELMKDEDIEDIPVVVGGVIPKQDIPKLKELGIGGVFPGGTPFDEIVTGIQKISA